MDQINHLPAVLYYEQLGTFTLRTTASAHTGSIPNSTALSHRFAQHHHLQLVSDVSDECSVIKRVLLGPRQQPHCLHIAHTLPWHISLSLFPGVEKES